MVAKLVVWDQTRELARRRMLRALGEFEVGGVETLIPIHRAILEQPAFIDGGSLHDVRRGRWLRGRARDRAAGASAGGGGRSRPSRRVQTVVTEVDGKRFEVNVIEPEHPGRTRLRQRRAEVAEREKAAHGADGRDRQPDAGDGAEGGGRGRRRGVPGDVLVVVEAMKMENEIVAHHAGTVEAVEIADGDQVSSGQAPRPSGLTDDLPAVAALELLA